MSKKYPEPDDIDDNLINSLVEPIPDLEQHNKIQKIEMDDINQFEQSNIKKNQSKNNSIKNNNNNILNFNMNKKDKDENKMKQTNNEEFYIKKKVNNDDNDNDNDNLFKSYDEDEFNGNNDFE